MASHVEEGISSTRDFGPLPGRELEWGRCPYLKAERAEPCLERALVNQSKALTDQTQTLLHALIAKIQTALDDGDQLGVQSPAAVNLSMPHALGECRRNSDMEFIGRGLRHAATYA